MISDRKKPVMKIMWGCRTISAAALFLVKSLFMRLNKILRKDYILFSLYYQIKLPLDVEILIPADAPVRLPV